MAKQAAKKPRKPRLRPFNVHFYLEGGTSVWLQERSESRDLLEQRTRELVDGAGTWMTLNCHSGALHVRREKVVGFQVEDMKAAELEPELMNEEDRRHWNDLSMMLDDRDINLTRK